MSRYNRIFSNPTYVPQNGLPPFTDDSRPKLNLFLKKLENLREGFICHNDDPNNPWLVTAPNPPQIHEPTITRKNNTPFINGIKITGKKNSRNSTTCT